MEPRSVYNSPKMATMMTRRDTEEMWYPVPINAENNIGCDAGRKTSPCTWDKGKERKICGCTVEHHPSVPAYMEYINITYLREDFVLYSIGQSLDMRSKI